LKPSILFKGFIPPFDNGSPKPSITCVMRGSQTDPIPSFARAVRLHEHGLGIPLSEVGFPIRKSTDQSFFAAPRGLSQRSTSFIASQRQGIHRMPLSHLIALIINAHSPRQVTVQTPSRLRRRPSRDGRPRLRKEAQAVWAMTERPACFEIAPRGVRSSAPIGYGCRTQLITAYNCGTISSSRCQTTCIA
jgi:hypothetical protein